MACSRLLLARVACKRGSVAAAVGFSTYPRDTRRAAQVRRMLTTFGMTGTVTVTG
jgi:hypothetical protein